jgi:aminopeptidase-like protein
MNPRDIHNLVSKLYPFGYSVVSAENDRAIPVFLEELDFDIVEIPSGHEHNGWMVPLDWRVIRAQIYRGDKPILDGMSSPLAVGALSPPFSGTVSLSELKKHIYYSDERPDAIPYHWTNLYRPAERDWAFCVKKSFYDSLSEGEYRVEIETSEKPGSMKILDFTLPGKSSKTILLNGHNCHPWQANDDLSGCAIGIAVMQALQKREYRKYSYRLVIAPELIGTVHWLAGLNSAQGSFIGAIMLKSLGNEGPLKLQHSFSGVSQLDKAASCVLRHRDPNYVSGPFRTIYGNDETVFDSPGYEIPTISLTRFPFDEYHTDADTPSRLSVHSLDESYDVVLDIINAMEGNETLKFAKQGLVALSHPRYGLYRAAPAPGLDKKKYLEVSRRWNLLMNCLPRELDGSNSTIDLALKYDLPVSEITEYLNEWAIKQLANVVSEDAYVNSSNSE